MLSSKLRLGAQLSALGLLAVMGLFATTAQAVVSEDSELFVTMKAMDSVIFEKGFNECDLKTMEKAVHPDFEFYHDVAGTQDKAEFMEGMKKSICSTPQAKPIRKLVPNSMRVFKMMKNGEVYGAIQSAEHEFYIKEPNKDLYLTSTAKFTHVWILVGEKWQLKESLSFEHILPSKNALLP